MDGRVAFLSRPGEADIQIDLFYDYRTNVANYLAWSAWLRLNQPPTLVIWGCYDPSFLVAETAAYQRDLPGAEVHILDAGHFALYEKPDEIAKLVGDFLGRTLSRPAAPSNDRDAAIRGCLSALGRWIR